MQIDEIDYVTTNDAIEKIAEDAGVKERFSRLRMKNLRALPNEKPERDKAENRERPNLTLKHSPRTAAVFHIGEVEKAVDDGKSRGSLEGNRGDFLGDEIETKEIRHRQRNDEKSLHFAFFSISL